MKYQYTCVLQDFPTPQLQQLALFDLSVYENVFYLDVSGILQCYIDPADTFNRPAIYYFTKQP